MDWSKQHPGEILLGFFDEDVVKNSRISPDIITEIDGLTSVISDYISTLAEVRDWTKDIENYYIALGDENTVATDVTM